MSATRAANQPLTDVRLAILLAFMERWLWKRPPYIHEIAAATGRGQTTVRWHLLKLEKTGHLARDGDWATVTPWKITQLGLQEVGWTRDDDWRVCAAGLDHVRAVAVELEHPMPLPGGIRRVLTNGRVLCFEL